MTTDKKKPKKKNGHEWPVKGRFSNEKRYISPWVKTLTLLGNC